MDDVEFHENEEIISRIQDHLDSGDDLACAILKIAAAWQMSSDDVLSIWASVLSGPAPQAVVDAAYKLYRESHWYTRNNPDAQLTIDTEEEVF